MFCWDAALRYPLAVAGFQLPSSARKLPLLLIVAAALVLVLSGTVLGWLRFAPVAVADGWRCSEVQGNLQRIVSLARMPDGSIVSTLSAKQRAGAPGMGRLIRLDIHAGHHEVLAEGLYKPAGLLPWEDGIVLTQEYPDQPVLLWKDGGLQSLMMLRKPESITVTPQGRWLIIEDSAGGRLLEVDPRDDFRQNVLFEGFVEGEGVCVGRDGRIFAVDRKRSDLLEYVDGEIRAIPAGLRGPGFLRCTAAGVWITEDVSNNGRLWFYDYERFHLVASHLHAPQSVLEDGDDAVLVAEQGRSRLLRFMRQPTSRVGALRPS